jgi:glycosyltransferase involved in cell wall biosynthesis
MMRLLVANHHGALLGGIETYLAALMPALAEHDCEIFFAHEAPIGNEAPIPLPPRSQSTLIDNSGLAQIKKWNPQLAFVHAIHDLALQQNLIETFPTVAFAHAYYGLCISGTKTWKRSPARPCAKPFDRKCLLHFHAKSCGGASPVTMLRDYFRQSRQLALLRRCDAVITHAGPMEREYLAQGIARERLFTLPHFAPAPKSIATSASLQSTNLIFIGRFDFLKGGHLLIEALPSIADRLNKPILLRMIGSGPAAADWKRRAEKISSDKIRIEFPGWIGRDQKDCFIAQSHLLVVPSIWPEPFGQVGLEANHFDIPAVAFDVGGISNWLRDGANGHLAPADPPTAGHLADAVINSLGNPEHYAKLRAGAKMVASEFTVQRHVRALISVFEKVLERRP